MLVTSVQACEGCGHEVGELDAAQECVACGGLLLVRHHAPDAAGAALRARFDGIRAADPDGSGVWRFREIVLPGITTGIVTHPEGNTPLLRRPPIAAWCGVDALTMKHEGHNPTGSFKDRGMTVGVSQARRVGATAVACASTGNTSASLASYAAHAGLPCLVFVPEGRVSPGKLAQTLAYGARTLLVDGDFDACLRLVRTSCAELGIYLLNSVNPFRIEGQKTIILELLQQLAWEPPDWIVFPAGNLGNAAAFGKALSEAKTWGLIDRVPRLAAVQASGAAPFAAAYHRGFDSLIPVEADTIATAIRIGNPASFARAVRAIRDTEGTVTSVSDAEILEAKAVVDRAGVGCEPASAAAVAGVRRLVADGWIGRDQTVSVILTGHLLKDPGADAASPDAWPDALPKNVPIRIAPDVGEVAAVLRMGGTGVAPPPH